MIGTSLSHYIIVGKLGEGGMGVVYKARDSHLDRFVAIKVLPAEKVADPDRRRRFVREAKAASALNHPNIIHVYDIDQADGVDFMAMEYVDGRTLDQLIPRKGMHADGALKIAVQIADALACAHAAGIVHRDLKPSNIMVDQQGLARTLDFGLAKLIEIRKPEEDSSTRTAEAATEIGAIVGTIAYMSPEQAEGKKVDARSDIFSFGAVLYEMLTGRRAFQGDSAPSTLAAVIKEQPKPPREIASGVTYDVEQLIMRCLQKDPGRRWQSMADVLVLLREMQHQSDAHPPIEGRSAWKKGRRWALAALPVLLLALAGAWRLWTRDGGLPPAAVVQLTTYPGSELSPSLSPDGDQVAFTWDGDQGDNLDIYVKLVGEMNPLRLTTDRARDEWPAWSPDGKSIAFQRSTVGDSPQVYLVSALGAAEQKLMPFPASGQMSWSPDGRWLAVSRRSSEFASPSVESGAGLQAQGSGGIVLLPADGGEARALTTPQAPRYHFNPAFSPDGRWLAYVEGRQLWRYGDVYVLPLGPDYSPRGAPRRVTQLGLSMLGLTWSSDGESLLFGAAFTLDTPRYLWRAWLAGEREPQRFDLAGVYAGYPTVARAGRRLAYSRDSSNYDIWRYQSGGATELLIASSLLDNNPQFSPDGNRIAFASARSADTSEIWVANADGSGPVQLTKRLGRYQGTPRWSPDGRWIAFDSQGQDGNWHIWAVEASGGPPRRLTSEPFNESVPSWSHDGTRVCFRTDRTGRREIWRVPFAGGPAEQVTRDGGFIAFESADGRALYYMKANDSPLFTVPLAGGLERQVLAAVVNRAFVVVQDGLYYIGRPQDRLYPFCFFRFSTGQSQLLTRLEGPLGTGLTVSPDRRTWLFTKADNPGSDLMLIENFR